MSLVFNRCDCVHTSRLHEDYDRQMGLVTELEAEKVRLRAEQEMLAAVLLRSMCWWYQEPADPSEKAIWKRDRADASAAVKPYKPVRAALSSRHPTEACNHRYTHYKTGECFQCGAKPAFPRQPTDAFALRVAIRQGCPFNHLRECRCNHESDLIELPIVCLTCAPDEVLGGALGEPAFPERTPQ